MGTRWSALLYAPPEADIPALDIALARAVDPREIAQALRYLIDAPSVTGQMIAIDSGQHLA